MAADGMVIQEGDEAPVHLLTIVESLNILINKIQAINNVIIITDYLGSSPIMLTSSFFLQMGHSNWSALVSISCHWSILLYHVR